MPVTGSGLFLPTFQSALGAGGLALNLDNDTHKVALFSNFITVDYSANTAYGVAPFNANEVTGTGWSAGGHVLANATWDESGLEPGTLMWDGDDILVAPTDLTGIRALLLYADYLGGNNAVCLLDLENDFGTEGGFLAIEWHGLGIFSVDLAPYAA